MMAFLTGRGQKPFSVPKLPAHRLRPAMPGEGFQASFL